MCQLGLGDKTFLKLCLNETYQTPQILGIVTDSVEHCITAMEC
jgi:hypothetical protein